MKFGFFEICSREMDECGREPDGCCGYQYRHRMQPWAGQLSALYTYAQRLCAPFVFTTCCGGSMLLPDSKNDVLFIPIDGADTRWQTKIKDYHCFYVEKIADCNMKENSEFDNAALFCYNRNVLKLVELLSVDEWIVYGNSLDFCVNDTVIGLLNAGQMVTFLSDVLCGSSNGTEESRNRTLEKWRTLGAIERASGELLASSGFVIE
jgi:hypothetical protein